MIRMVNPEKPRRVDLNNKILDLCVAYPEKGHGLSESTMVAYVHTITDRKKAKEYHLRKFHTTI